ncbi:MAG TPA: hypothetical protein VFQ53_03850 [Kofleriaceae bacterium]|nr:hypothetical protein [Kofleriaceae bacterium]
MLLSMIVLTALATLSGLTVVSVQGGITTSSNDRFHQIAVYAAESGGAAAMDFLRKNVNKVTGWQKFISANNANPQQPNIPGNNAPIGTPGNLFSTDMQGWYSVTILNNRSDPGFTTGADSDKRVIIRSTGYGPNGAIAIIEWEISAANITGLGRPCPGYGQKGMGEDGAGRNDCLGTINTGTTATFRPGG